MSKDKVREYLADLKHEIAGLKGGDANVRDRLNSLTAEIEQVLNGPADSRRKHALAESVRAHTEQFEAEHPDITSVLDKIMVTLSNMGI
jgi:hypothetical protein